MLPPPPATIKEIFVRHIILNINARSLSNKVTDFIALIWSHSPHIIGITETWLHDEIHDDEITLPGYNKTRAERKHCRGGGITLLKSDPNFSVMEVPVE